jgi:hypothetical protein
MLSRSRCFLCKQTMLLSLFCYKFACHYFSYACRVATISIPTLDVTLLRRRRVLRWRLLLGVWAPRHLPVMWCFVPLLRPLGLVIRFCNKTRCKKHWLYYLFHYLSLYVWKLILAHIKVCIQFWPWNWVWHFASRPAWPHKRNQCPTILPRNSTSPPVSLPLMQTLALMSSTSRRRLSSPPGELRHPVAWATISEPPLDNLSLLDYPRWAIELRSVYAHKLWRVARLHRREWWFWSSD